MSFYLQRAEGATRKLIAVDAAVSSGWLRRGGERQLLVDCAAALGHAPGGGGILTIAEIPRARRKVIIAVRLDAGGTSSSRITAAIRRYFEQLEYIEFSERTEHFTSENSPL